jgi:hypothetical protein
MTPFTFPQAFTLAALSLLALVGCTSEVVDATHQGSGGGGGGGECAEYAGDGCTPGDTLPCSVPDPSGVGTLHSTDVCSLVEGKACTTGWSSGCNTPLVLSFDGGPVAYGTDRTHGFDVNGGESLVTDWPTAKTPWLALDRDGDGRIADGRELFGSMSPLALGGRAENGFVALRELDDDGDGRITQADASFARLLVWSDVDADRSSTPSELASAASWGLIAIDLDYRSEGRCDLRRNCEVERASFRFRESHGEERVGAIIDVHLAPQR